MYNEKTRQPVNYSRTPVHNGAAPRRDIPLTERYEDMHDRRKCDGSLRNYEERRTQEPECPACKCGGWGLDSHPLAMVFSPCHVWRNVYAPDVALCRGTLFAELDLPFEPSKGRRGCM